MCKLARTMQAAENWEQAANDYRAYVNEFDPEAVEGKPKVEKPGVHICQAYFELGHCLEKLGRQEEARRTWQDLAAAAEKKIAQLQAGDARKAEFEELGKLRADAMYRIA